MNVDRIGRAGRALVAGLFVAVLVPVIAGSEPAHAATTVFSNSSVITIPESGPATPYPSPISVSGLVGTITDVNVTLNDVTHTFPNELAVLVVAPNGQAVQLLELIGGPGGENAVDVDLTFDQQAAQPLPAAPWVSGTYQPTSNAGFVMAYPPPAPATYTETLAAFNGLNPNGTWGLYVVDTSTFDDSGAVEGGWSIEITTTPALSVGNAASQAEGDSGTTTHSFQVTLDGPAPAGGVTFDIATADGTATTASGDYVASSLTGQTIPAGSDSFQFNVVANGDLVDEPNETFFVNVTNITGAVAVDTQAVGTIIDDDVAGVVVAPTSGLTTTEAGGTATFTVVLASPPAANVTIGLAANDASEGEVDSSALLFGAGNWDDPQTVTITGLDDDIDDGPIAYSVVTSLTTTDPAYAALNPADVAVSNTDDDAAGIVVAPTSGLTTTEGGGEATYTLVLASQPMLDVLVDVMSNDESEGTVAPATITFTAQNWDLPQTITVTGVDDDAVDGPIDYGIVTLLTTEDPNYTLINVPLVAVTNVDDDVPPTTTTTTTTAAPTTTTTEPTTSTTTAATTTTGPVAAPTAPPTTMLPVGELPVTGGSPSGPLAAAVALLLAGLLTLGFARTRTRTR